MQDGLGGYARPVAKLLVVDDCTITRELLALKLAVGGHRVEKAEDGVSGFDAAVRGRPDLIISDIDMPRSNGLEFLAALRSDSALHDIPVIFVSSLVEKEARAKDLGAAAFLAKPVSLDRLLSLIAETVPAKKGRATED